MQNYNNSRLLRRARLVFHVRRGFLRVLMWIAVVCLGVWGLYTAVGGKVLKPIARRQISQLTGTDVSIKSIEFKSGGLVKMSGLVVGAVDSDRYDSEILVADSLDVRFSVWSLLRFKPRIKNVMIDDFVLSAQYDADAKSWNLGQFDIDTSGDGGGAIPKIFAKRGILKASRVSGDKIDTLAVVGVSGEFKSVADVKDAYRFSLAADDRLGLAGSKFSGVWTRGDEGTLSLVGKLLMGKSPVFGNSWDVEDVQVEMRYGSDGVHFDNLDWRLGEKFTGHFEGSVSEFSGQGLFDIKGRLENVELYKEARANVLVYDRGLIEKVLPMLKGFFDQYSPEGVCDIELDVAGRFDELEKCEYAGAVVCKNISIKNTKFPYQLDEIKGRIELANQSIIIDDLQSSHGEINLSVDGFIKGKGAERQCEIRLLSENMQLNEDLYVAMNPLQKKLWFSFAPSGLVRLDYLLTASGEEKPQYDLNIDLIDAQAVYQYFPYPLKNVTGKVYIGRGRFELIKVVSKYDGKEITLNGKVTGLKGSEPKYHIEIDAKGVPIDAMLKEALPAEQRAFYEKFEVDAVTDATIKIVPSTGGKQPVDYTVSAKIKDAELKYEGFPLSLTDANLDAVLTMDTIVIKELAGKWGDADVFAKGYIWPMADGELGPGLCMEIKASGLEINDELLGAIPEKFSKTVSQFQPVGKVNLDVVLNVDARGDEYPAFKVDVECLGNDVSYDKVPCSVTGMTGKINISEGAVAAEQLKGELASGGKVVLDGSIVLRAGAADKGEFSFEAVDVQINEKLMGIFASGGGFFRGVRPSGKLDLKIDKANYVCSLDGVKTISSDAEIVFKDCGFGRGGLVTDFDGRVDTSFSYQVDKGLLASKSDVKAKSLKVKGREINGLRAGIEYDPEKGIFYSKDVLAGCYEGKIVGEMVIALNDEKSVTYSGRVAFDKISVKDVLTAKLVEGDPSDHITGGLMSGAVSVGGDFGLRNSMVGRLNMKFSDMTVAKRSLLGKVVVAMQIDDPSDFIFSDMTVDAYIKNDSIFFEHVYIIGKSMVLHGKGDMYLKNNLVDLDFHAYGKEDTSDPSFLESLARGVGPALVTIRVDGDLGKPKIETTTLPVIKRPLELLGPER